MGENINTEMGQLAKNCNQNIDRFHNEGKKTIRPIRNNYRDKAGQNPP